MRQAFKLWGMSLDALVSIIHNPAEWTEANKSAFDSLFGAP